MTTISASTARQQLFPLIAEVNQDHVDVRITSKAGNAVLISEEDFESWQTTRYLFSTAANATHLLESLAQARDGQLLYQDLDEE
ncbi:MAG: type II toxin-antitoxin system Phd/YefM family antitoxin [Bifidobacteriaceae bacterium]|jgi:antitoxin YefM|nr:type II toxin-antitoxin system Phd/YefM family antitoxin [Bifidobacteriaceae bacterium]